MISKFRAFHNNEITDVVKINFSTSEIVYGNELGIDIRDNNRKSDRLEYLEFAKKLDEKFVPISLAKFQELKYNDAESYKELKDRVIWNEAKFPSEKSFNGHFKTHGNEFVNISKEQYQKAAASLLAEPVSEDILGYDTEFRRVRYDHKNNIYALGNPKTKKITTMFRPKGGKEYYNGEISKDLGN